MEMVAPLGLNGFHRFSLRGSDSVSPGRRKISEPWPMPERAMLVASIAREFFYPRAEPVGSDCATPNLSGGLHDGSAHQ